MTKKTIPTPIAKRRTIDFDAFRAEQNEEPLELTIKGRAYSLPTALPAILALDVLRLNALGQEQDIPMDEVIRIGQALFGGEEQFRTVLTEGEVTLMELPDLIKVIVEAYTSDAEPDPEAPTQA